MNKKNLKLMNIFLSITLGFVFIIGFGTFAVAQSDNTVDRLANLAEKVGGNPEVMLAIMNYLNNGNMIGAFITSGTNFTDVAISNDLTVDGLSTLTGAVSMSGALDVGRLTQGGAVFATTSNQGLTLTEAQLLANMTIDLTLGDNTEHVFTLPATSTLTTAIPNEGDSMIMRLRAIGTTASASTTVTLGVGIDLVENEAGDVEIEAGNEALLRFTREADTDVTVSVTEYIAAD